jgi:hypothetical protein
MYRPNQGRRSKKANSRCNCSWVKVALIGQSLIILVLLLITTLSSSDVYTGLSDRSGDLSGSDRRNHSTKPNEKGKDNSGESSTHGVTVVSDPIKISPNEVPKAESSVPWPLSFQTDYNPNDTINLWDITPQ